MLGGGTDMWDALDRRCSSTDDGNTLLGQPVQVSARVAARVLVIPAARMKRVSLELVDARDVGQPRTVQRAGRGDDESGLHRIVSVGADDPATDLAVPLQRRHVRLEAREVI